MNRFTSTDPIDHAIVACLALVEGIAWVINELAGHHRHAPAPSAPAARITATVHTAPLTVQSLINNNTQRQLMILAGTKSKRSKKYLAEKIINNR